MKIFVTGITGFIGSNLWDFLNKSDEIYVLARGPVESHGFNVKIIQGDLNAPQAVFDELKVIKPDLCIHLAWEGIPDFSYEMSSRNLQQGMALLRCLVEECGCRKIIVGGSCFEYGKSIGVCREDDSDVTHSYFTWAKHSLYEFGKLLSIKYAVTLIWFRIFYVYGPGQRRGSLIPTLVDTLRRGELPAIKTPLNANDFVYVKDIAEALGLAVSHEMPTGIYNLGAGVSVPVWKVWDMLEKSMGVTSQYATQMKSSAVQSTADYWADTSKVSSVLGWSARTSLEQGLKQYISSVEKK